MKRFQAADISISIHALLAESDKPTTGRHDKDNIFLSTLSLRRATSGVESCSICSSNFYPRSPCGERPVNFHPKTGKSHFYPRSPCGERRESQPLSARPTTDFYPRSPCGERRGQQQTQEPGIGISIHALLAESDRNGYLQTRQLYAISIHALLAESDTPTMTNLYSYLISIHALLAESDSKPKDLKSRRIVFLSTLSLRRATGTKKLRMPVPAYFYPRSPCGERRLF